MATSLITLIVNGVKRTIPVEEGEKLIDVLREKLHLTGTKRGCDNAQCSSCVVVVNGKAEKSCLLSIQGLEGAEVFTVESLASQDKLHPIQQAFIDAGAVQCGFCTPGMLMRMYALLNKTIHTSEEEIRDALSQHLCRCTGYETVLTAGLLAQEYMLKNV